jgi:purine-binding chemotaxis protein CheW
VVREVVAAPNHFARVPKAPTCVRGIINLRGRVVTVVDALSLLRPNHGVVERPTTKVVLLEQGRRELGLLVTEVDGIESIEKVGPAPPKAAEAVKGVARLGALAITLLELEALDQSVTRAFKEA